MKETIEAIFENGTFRPLQPETVGLPNGQVVRLTVESSPKSRILELAARVYEGLSEEEIDDIQRIALDRSNFFGSRSTK
jgi:predicted DNA-binding antitoxin AbrB/MazE fold protein